MFVSSLFGYNPSQEFVGGATFTPVQSSQTTLAGAGITSSQTTIQVTSFTLPDPNRTPISMSMFGTVGYAVLEPQTSRIENIKFTGVTQNANGSATLTGVSRGLSFYSPYNASTTLALSHAGGSYLILSNSGAFYGKEFAFTNNPSYITSPWYFTDPPTFYNVATSTNQAASVAYVNGVAFGSTLIPKAFGGTGVTGFPIGSFVYDDGTGTTLKATSSPTFGWIYATSSTLSYFNGPLTANGALTALGAFNVTGNSTFTGNVVASSTTNLIASSTQYSLNVGAINATSTIKLNGFSLGNSVLYSTSANNSSVGAEATLASITLPASTLNTSKMIRVTATFGATTGSVCTFKVIMGNGSASTTVAQIDALSGSAVWVGRSVTNVIATSTATMFTFTDAYAINTNAGSTQVGIPFVLANSDMSTAYASYSTTVQNYIALSGTASSATCNLFNATVELLSQ